MAARLLRDLGEVGREGVGPRPRQLAVQLRRLLGGLERRLAPPESAQPVRQVVEGHGQIGREGVGPRPRQLAVQRRRLLGGLERRLAPPEIAQHVRQVVEGHRPDRA